MAKLIPKAFDLTKRTYKIVTVFNLNIKLIEKNIYIHFVHDNQDSYITSLNYFFLNFYYKIIIS